MLVAGPLYQGSVELDELDVDREKIKASAVQTAQGQPSAWWWLLPVISIAMKALDNRPLPIAFGGSATDLRVLGKLEAARKLDEDTLTWLQRIMGDDHPRALTVASNLAVDLPRLGEVRAACNVGEEAFRRRSGTLGKEHPNTLSSVSNLAIDLYVLGEIQAARDPGRGYSCPLLASPRRRPP